MLSLNISFVDSFGAVGWTLITINQTSGTSFNAWAFFKKHVRVLLSLMLLAIIIPFSLCWRFHTAAKHLYGTSQFAKLYLRLTDQSRNDLGVDRDLMQRREDIMSKISTIDDPASDFHHEQIQANVDEFCRSIVRVGCLSSETATPVDIISQLELYGCIQRLFTLVKDRLEHCPVLPDDRLLINTRRVIGYTNSILEAILVIVGHQYSHVPAPPSLLRYILLAPWTWLQKCFRSAENGADHHLRLSIDYDLRAELLKTLRASVFSLVGVFGIIPGLQFLISYRTLAIDCQLDILFGLELLREGILHIPDSESRMSLCTRSMGHLCSISKLLADVTDLLVTSSSWFHLYLTAAIRLKELSSPGSRITELQSFQEHGYRSIVLSCWGSSRLPACSRVCRKITCGRVPLSDWKLVYGLLKLFGDALLTASDEVFAEGIQGSDSEPNSQRLTVSFIKAQSRTCHCAFGGIWKSIEEVAKQLISTYSPRQGSSVDVGASSVLHGMSTPNEHVRDVFAAVSPPSHSEQPLLGEENLKVSSDVFISVTPNPMDEVLADVLTPAPRPHDADGKQLPGFPPLPRLRAVRGSVSGSAGTPTPSPSPSPLAPDEIRRASPANEVVILQPATAPIVGNGRPLVMLRHVMHPPPRLQPVPVVHPPQLPNQLTTPPAEPECPSPRRK